MENTGLRIFDVVRVRDTAEARSIGMVGREAVILGVSEDEGDRKKWFAIRIERDESAVMISSRSVEWTGRSVPRESVYSGETIRVSRAGEILGDASRDGGSSTN